MRRLIAILLLGLMLALPCTASAAVENLARDYIPAPPGTFATLLYYEHISADNLWRGNKKIATDLGLSGNIGLFRPVYWMQLGPMIVDPQFIIPFGNLSISSGPLPAGLGNLNTNNTGFGDSLWFATFWFIHNDKSKFYVGFTPIFIAPTGTYVKDPFKNIVSLGANRWSFFEQLGVVKGFEVIPGHTLYGEVQVAGQFYTNNNAFPVSNTETGTLSQTPEFDLECHLSYDVTKTMWASFDYYGNWGACQKLNGNSLANSINTQTVGLTLAYSFAPGYQLALQYKSDVGVRSGTQNNIVLARFLWATDLKGIFGGEKK
jgi:hypothetical protein